MLIDVGGERRWLLLHLDYYSLTTDEFHDFDDGESIWRPSTALLVLSY